MQQMRQETKTKGRKQSKDLFAMFKQVVEKVFLGHLFTGLNTHMDLAHRNKNRNKKMLYFQYVLTA